MPGSTGAALKQKQKLFVFISLTPIMIFFFMFFVYPVIYAIVISLHKWPLLAREKPFVGFKNYAWAFNDDVFWISLKNTIYYAVFFVSSVTILGLALAMFVNSFREPIKSINRMIFFLPVITSMVAVALMFVWLYQPMFGLLNYILGFIGLGPFKWIYSPQEVLPSIILMSVWKYVGYTMVLFLAGLTTIPHMYYEAARIDGAKSIRVFLNITLPLLVPTILFVLVTNTISAFQVFTQVFMMTRGGPGTASRVLVLHMYDTGFRYFEMGKASALAFILFSMILIITILQVRYFRESFEY